MANFEKFYPTLAKSERGYLSAVMARKYKDNGGETYNGIARNFNPHWAGWAIVDKYKAQMGTIPHGHVFKDANLDLLVKNTTKHNYWDMLSLDKVKNQTLANFAADFGFNSGTGTVAKAIQKYFKIVADGIVGEGTLSYINKKVNEKPLFDFLKAYRKKIISGLDDPQTVKDALVERTDGFFFSRRASVVIVLPIVAGIAVLGIMYRKDIHQIIK